MVRRNRARFLALLALAAAIVGTYLIVHASLTSKPSAAHSHTAAGHGGRAHGKFAKQSFYVVQPGDSLTSIAAKTGIALTTLETLNPKVDPNSLQMGQRLRLRR